MQLAVGSNDDFLDGNSAIDNLSGRWNDDIGWWALGIMTAAEATPSGIIDPQNIDPGFNPTYFSVANNTFWEMYIDWDDVCGGGIYWSRDRTTVVENDAYYKSSISNAQFIDLGARLYAITNDANIKTLVDTTYQWMLSSGLVSSSTFTVLDGLYAEGSSCTLSTAEWSYHSGELVSGLSEMYKNTGDTTYLTAAHNHFNHIQSYFTENNVLYDPNLTSANKDPSGYLWAVYKGLAILHSVTTDSTVKSDIETIMYASATANFQKCNSEWYCIRNLAVGTTATMSNGTNPRDQFETVAILNALSVMAGASTSGLTQNTTTATNTDETTDNSGSITKYAEIGGGAAAGVVVLGLLGCWFRKRARAAAAVKDSNLSLEIYGDAARNVSSTPSPSFKNQQGRFTPQKQPLSSNGSIESKGQFSSNGFVPQQQQQQQRQQFGQFHQPQYGQLQQFSSAPPPPPPGSYGTSQPGQFGTQPQYGVPLQFQQGPPLAGQYGMPPPGPPGQFRMPPPGPPGQFGMPPPGQYGGEGLYGAGPMPTNQYAGGAPQYAGRPPTSE
ncbi:hydrolase 76 protein [Physocladia obscura]|uniref:mannan endo-1,6-alpha-mannosidase n=1 Tax=Physocladia obscura TaxID=109957 RepID=A0AAD5T488_9FUNG|nr:hydrolase 76 protein [Physocladia obscura]